jgi:AcrR family transcriptional regulator
MAPMNEGDAGLDEERQRLIAAAWTVLGRSSFEGFKVQLLLRETGLSARTFYRHFADKDALFVTLMTDEYARAGAQIQAAVERAGDPVGKVAAWIEAILGTAAHPGRAARARLFTSGVTVARRFAGDIAAAERPVLQPLEEAIGAGRAAGDFPWAEPSRDARMTQQLAGGAMIQALAGEDPEAIEELVSHVTDFVLRALGHRRD